MKTTIILLLASLGYAAAQGSLAPPAGAPAPTMKTLDQIESRIAIPPSPATPIAGPHFIITQPGSYYLTGNITVSTGDGIQISSDQVSLDLNGFTINSTAAATNGIAIHIVSSRARVSIRNGFITSGSVVTASEGQVSVAGFGDGVISNSTVTQIRVDNVHVYGVAQYGIFLDRQGVVSNCTVRGVGRGMVAKEIRDCSAEDCSAFGIIGRNVMNSHGGSGSGIGLSAVNATNSSGESIGGIGLSCSGNATNCSGKSASNTAISVSGTASFCRGNRTNAGVAISANIAIGCTVDGTGTVVSPQKHLGTP